MSDLYLEEECRELRLRNTIFKQNLNRVVAERDQLKRELDTANAALNHFGTVVFPKIQRERDALLEACKAILPFMGGPSTAPRLYEQIRAAIALVEGKEPK